VSKLSVPVIGIGAGPATDGQVLVWHDLLGIYDGHRAKFVKRYANLREQMLHGVGEYAREVRARAFPGPEHSYAIDGAELEAFRRYLEHESLAGNDAFGGDWSATEI
jgi:3-methyl-2-oxobutanoate hydroxymethyltransferase